MRNDFPVDFPVGIEEAMARLPICSFYPMLRVHVTNPRTLLLLCASVMAAVASAQTRLPRVEFSDTTLDNGLRVIIVPEHTAPIFAISLTYNTGSRNEKQGRTGLAH